MSALHDGRIDALRLVRLRLCGDTADRQIDALIANGHAKRTIQELVLQVLARTASADPVGDLDDWIFDCLVDADADGQEVEV